MEERKTPRRLTKAQRMRLRRRRRARRIALGALAAALLAILVWLLAAGLFQKPQDNAALPTPAATPTIAATPSPTPSPTPQPTQAPQPQLITITAVGDCTLGGNTNDGGDGEKRFRSHFEKNGADYYLQNFRALFEADDLTLANLEGPLTTATDKRSGRTFNFRGDPSYAQILSGSGVDVCNVANNHAYDFKRQGLEDTAAALQAENLGVCGFGYEDFREVNGITIGNLGFTEWDYDADEIESAVRAAREKCDLLIVSIHWGEELEDGHDSTTRRLGKLIVDAGADLVVGNHSHIRGEIARYKGKYVIYSLGNFCFGGNTRPTDMRCIVFQQTFRIDPDGSVSDWGINLIPARVSSNAKQNNLQPVYLEDDEAEKLLGELGRISKLDATEVIWMPDSYEASHGMLSADASIAASLP